MSRGLVLAFRGVAALAISILFVTPGAAEDAVTLRGEIVDADTGEAIEARLYIESDDGTAFHATSRVGVAVPYEKVRGESREVHTTLSADPFEATLPPGTYLLTAERGKEYLSTTRTVIVGEGTSEVNLALRRWEDMNKRGWFSGETHVHRPVRDLPTLMKAEELNVAFPLTAWVARAEETPLRNNRNPEIVPQRTLIEVEPARVIWPVNTEYEINSVKGQRHPIGALFVLNHSDPLDISSPPVGAMVKEARSQGAFFDLDKHNWPWSMMLVPVAGIDLYELTNNHIWRTDFAFTTWYTEYAPEFMGIERDGEEGITERGWIDWGFKNYYALLNCGFRIMPSAGTASGVHPVPFAFGRVYVKVDGEFSYEKWVESLLAGNSFVTTGPMIEVTMGGMDPGSHIPIGEGESIPFLDLEGEVRSADPIEWVEIIQNGVVQQRVKSTAKPIDGVYTQVFGLSAAGAVSSWWAVRVFARTAEGRIRFAHSAPFFVDVAGKPQKPKRHEVEYLLQRVEDEIERHDGVLSVEAVDEFREAARFYRELLSR